MEYKLPTLSRHGWLESTPERMNKLFEHFLAADYSQTTQLPGEVSSLKYILASTKDEIDLKAAISDALYKLYGAYFTTVFVEVETTSTDDTSITTILISIAITDSKNKQYYLKQAVENKNGSIVRYYKVQDDLYRTY